MLTFALLLLASPLFAPQLLAFPYRAETPIGPVRSEQPLDPVMLDRMVTQVRARLATSPLAEGNERRSIFVTTGGWRWRWLATRASGAFAVTRPLTRNIVVNATDPRGGTIRNGRSIGGRRRLDDVLAHEFTHGLIRRHLGEFAAATQPDWKVEGYCDHVAGASSLTAADVAQLERKGADHPALAYYRGRLRVEAILKGNGGDVEALFAGD